MSQRARHPADDEPLVRIALRRVVRRMRTDAVTPGFGRLLGYQATGAAGDALVALALAGSLFFSVPEATARGSAARYLLLTMAPFAVIAPFLARFLDRHRGRMRISLVAAAVGRALFTWWMSTRLDSLLLFPLAFGVLVLSRASLVIRGAFLPQVIPEGHSFVTANASLSRTAAFSGMVAVVPGVMLIKWPGVKTEMLLGAAVYALGIWPAFRLPGQRGRRPEVDTLGARARAQSVSIRQAFIAVAGMRLFVGFLVFHLAFALRREDVSSIGLGLLVGAAALGGLAGAMLAPRLRKRLREEGILVMTLVVAGGAGVAVGYWFSTISAGVLVFSVGLASGAAKVAFDSIVQRETPEAARGWAFARFESALQFAWVLGAFIPLGWAISAGPGVLAAGIVANVIAIVYVAGRFRVRSRSMP